MTTLIIEKTSETPYVNFNYETGVLKITGRAYSNNINEFFEQLDSWFDEYLSNPRDTTIELYLDYYNSVFHKLLFIFLKKGKILIDKNKKLVIKWYLHKGDEDSIEACVNFTKNLNFPFEKIEID